MVPGGVGSTLPQRTQLRSLGGLATPHIGWLQMITSPVPASSSSAEGCVQPQSMQQIALGSIAAPQAGHLPPPEPDAGIFGSWNSPDEGGPPAWLPPVPPRPPAAGTMNILPQPLFGHLSCLPAEPSGT